MNWNEQLPDVDKWQPYSGRRETLSSGLLLTCQVAQNRIIAEAEIEKKFNIRNFDSGLGVEDVVRQEISKLLPRRYFVDKGVVNDRKGRTAEDCDIVIRDPIWSPVLKLGATPESRRFHFPIESIYAGAEVKQTLGFEELDKAMEKLVKLSRLERPANLYGHITENQHIPKFDRPGCILNPLHTAIIGIGISGGIEFRDIAFRFGQINASLERSEMVTMLCVLGHGAVWYEAKDTGTVNATYMTDRDKQLLLAVHDQEPDNTFYRYFSHISGHLHRSVLNTTNIDENYGEPVSKYYTYPCLGAQYNSHIREADSMGSP